MIISAAAFLENEQMRKEVQHSFDVRMLSLELARSIDGYDDAPRDVKNYIYDSIRDRLLFLS